MADIKNIRASGSTSPAPDYTDLTTWEVYAQGAFNDTQDMVAECWGDDFGGTDGALAETLSIAGWASGATYGAIVRAAAGQEHHGIGRSDGGTGFKILGAGAPTISPNTTRVTLSNIEISGVGNYPCVRSNPGGSASHLYEDLLLENTATAASNVGGIDLNNGSIANVDIINVRIITSGRGIDFRDIGGGSLLNSTIAVYGGSHGIFAMPSLQASNNAIFGGTTVDYWTTSGVPSGSNNASGDSSATGADPQTGIVTTAGVDFVNPSINDYNPAVGGKLDGTGANLSTTFTDDITGYTRVAPWEIGAYEIQGGVVPTPPTNVEAGGPYSGTVGTPIAIDGASYTPGTGANESILWTNTGSGTWSDNSILSPTFTPDGVDTYTLTLTITNDAGSDADTASLTATAATLNEMYINDGGTFKQATPYIKEGGVFVAADAYVRSGGAWVKVQDK